MNKPTLKKKSTSPKKGVVVQRIRNPSGNGNNSKVVTAPVAISNRRRTNRPEVNSSGRKGDILVKHREYIADVAGSVGFTAVSYAVNPGLPGTFPWLAALARNFESYRFRKLRFCYETESSTATVGTLILTLDYDPADLAPESKTQALSYRNAVRSAPWDRCCHDSLPEDLNKLKSHYVRTGVAPAGTDIKTYDIGNLFICTQAEAGTTMIGELYVEYEVELITPQIGSVSLGGSVSAFWTNLIGSSTPSADSTLPVTVSKSGTTDFIAVFTFTQPFQGVYTYTLTGSGLTPEGFAAANGATISVQESLDNGAGTAESGFCAFSSPAGGTLTFTSVNTTLTTNKIWIAQGVQS